MAFIDKILIIIMYLLSFMVIYLILKRFSFPHLDKKISKNKNSIPTMRDYRYR